MVGNPALGSARARAEPTQCVDTIYGGWSTLIFKGLLVCDEWRLSCSDLLFLLGMRSYNSYDDAVTIRQSLTPQATVLLVSL